MLELADEGKPIGTLGRLTGAEVTLRPVESGRLVDRLSRLDEVEVTVTTLGLGWALPVTDGYGASVKPTYGPTS